MVKLNHNKSKFDYIMPEESQVLKEKKIVVKPSRNQIIKIIILGALTFLAGLLAWFALARILNSGLTFNGENIWTFIVDLFFPVWAFCLWVAFIGIDAIFIHKKLMLYPIYILSIGPLFLYFKPSLYTVSVFIILMIAYIYFAFGVKKEQKDRIKFQVLNALKIHLGITLIFCVAAVSLLFYEHIAVKQEGGETKTNEVVASSVANFLNIFLETQLKNYNPNMTLDEFVLTVGQQFMEKIGPQLGGDSEVSENYKTQNIVNEIEKAIKSGEIKQSDLPADIINKMNKGVLTAQDIVEAQATDLFSEQLTAARDDFLKQLEISAEGSDKISEVLKKIVSVKLSEGLLPFVPWLPPFLAISLFFTLVIFDFLYVIFAKIFALLIYLIMLTTKFIVIKKETKEVEIAELS